VIEPILGWRVWKLRRGRLGSWVIDFDWHPGENRATCLTMNSPPCDAAPGEGCQCGFWAVWSPRSCVARVGHSIEPPWCVMGLMTGWGTVALHRHEGFRAEYAAPTCLFTDRPWGAATRSTVPGWLRDWWRRRRGRSWEPEPPFQQAEDPRRAYALREVAGRYGVPLLSIEAASDIGMLAELGVPLGQVEEAMSLSAG
jgi:hypothetical protein